MKYALSLVLLTIPFWGIGQNNAINKNKDSTVYYSLHKKEEVKSEISENYNSSKNKLNIFKKRFNDSGINRSSIINVNKKKSKFIVKDTGSRIKPISIAFKKKLNGYLDSFKDKKDTLRSITHQKSKKSISRDNCSYLDSNKLRCKKFYIGLRTKIKDLVRSNRRAPQSDTSQSFIQEKTDKLYKKKNSLSSDLVKTKRDSLFAGAKDSSQKLLTKIKNKSSKLDIIGIQGTILLESYNSTIAVPFSSLNPNYQRLTMDATVRVFGLPLKTEGYYTTDKSGYYPSNMFRVYFDAESLKQDGINKIQQTKETEENKLKAKFNETKEKQEKELKNTLAFKNYYSNRKSSFENNLNSQYKNLKIPQNDTIDKLLNKPDFSLDTKLQKFDSLKQIRPDLNLPDTSALRKYINTKTEIASLDSINQGLNNKLNGINNKWKSDSLILVSQIDKNKNRIAESKSNLSKISTSELIGSLKVVQVGTINPRFSELSISGISVKGFGIKVGGKSWSLETFQGKTYSFKNGQQKSPAYDFPIYGFQLRTKFKQSEYFIHSTFLKENIPGSLQNSQSRLFGGGAIFNALKNNLTGTIEIAAIQNNKSFTLPVQNMASVETNSTYNQYFITAIKKIALYSSINYASKKIGALKLIYKTIQPEFQNSLAPFLRKDFTETQIQWQKKYFKNKLIIKGSYKYLSDNLHNIKPSTNKIKGFGLEAKGQFTNGLMISLMYQPYDLSNNNPDTLYRTRNKFSIIQSTIMYIVNAKKHLHVFSLIGMMNKTNYSGVLSQTYSLNAMANLSFNSKYLLELNVGSNFIPNNDDSLNYHSLGINAGIKKKLSKGYEIDIYSQTSSMLYKSNDYLIQSGLTVNSKFKSGTIFGITGMWGLNELKSNEINSDFYTLKILIKRPINYNLNKSNFNRNKK